MMDADAYEAHHGFVWEYGRDLVALLHPQPGERVLDLGCGGGQLTKQIADAGATVTGVDLDPDLINLAQGRFPQIRWVRADISELDLGERFDAVFSNAVLHWPADPHRVARVVANHLDVGGRFVAEFGGATNCAGLIGAMQAAHPDGNLTHPWYFPTEEEYAAVLATVGLEPELLIRFRRPTRLDAGPAGWVRAFGEWATKGLEDVEGYLEAVQAAAKPALWRGDHWVGDYVRLRVVARRL